MKHIDNFRNGKLISSTAMILSAALILGGTGVRIRATAEQVPHAAEDELPEGVGRSYSADELPMTVGLAGENREESVRRTVSVFIDGEKYSGSALLYKDTTYVGIREFTTRLAGAAVSWDEATSTATAVSENVTVTATKGTEYISANGRYFWARTGILINDGTMYVPVRTIAAAYDAAVEWNGETYTVSVTSGSGFVQSGESYYNEGEVYWLSKIIHAESRGEVLTGKIAVGNVVLNRMNHPDYPDTIYGVIFDRKYGVQFSPVADGSINIEPNAESVIAAKLCLEGYTVSDSILFFINPTIAASTWVTTARPHEISIGNHDFYA